MTAKDRIEFIGVNFCFKMAITATHGLGLGKPIYPIPHLCLIYGETLDSWIGRLFFDYENMFDMVFPKESTRQLDALEEEEYQDVINSKKCKLLLIKHYPDSLRKKGKGFLNEQLLL
jgi:hypothetical protein